MEISIQEKIDKTYLNDEDMNEYTDYLYNDNTIITEETEYNRLNNQNINLILDYYKIPKGKLNKHQKILKIILFEQNTINIDIVTTRKILWECIRNIKQDNFMKKYLLVNVD